MVRYARVWMLFALAVLVAIVFWPSTQVLGAEWQDLVNLGYTHGWLILAVCVALVVRARGEIAAAPARPWPLALLALAVCIFVWLVCYRASIQDLQITVFPAIFWLVVAGAFGWEVGRLLLFPVAFFYFAVPSWSQLGGPLQSLAVAAMRVFLGITGPQAQIHGDLIHIPYGTFRILEGCSGLHYMVVGLAVAALHGELRRDPWKTRVAQLSFMAALALLANWVRIYVVIQAGYLTHMHSRLLHHHYWFGWGVFAVALVVFFWVTARFGPDPTAAPAAPLPPRPMPAAARADVAGFVIAAAVLVALPALSAAVRAVRPAAPLDTALAADPPTPWVPVLVDIQSSWQPQFRNADRQQRLAFANSGGDTVETYAVTYRTQRQDAKLVGSGSTVIGATLTPRTEQVVQVPGDEFREDEVTERASPHRSYLIWSRYETAGRHFVIPLASQLWYGINATVSNPSATLVAFRAECRPDCANARHNLEALAAGRPEH